MGLWNRVARRLATSTARPRGKEDARVYAVGDIHGRLDLLDRLLAQIEADIASRPARRTFVVFLGDLIDRGPDSAGVVERLRSYRPSGVQLAFLIGNHEEVLIRVLDAESDVLDSWLRFGGAECAASYGVDAARLRCLDERAGAALLRQHIPESHIDFIQSFADTFRFGDYLFVHAGIRPGIALENQSQRDLRWIRTPFLTDTGDHGFLVIHGHTIVEEVEERSNRIAIDTGAIRSGVLTAVMIEDEKRIYLST